MANEERSTPDTPVNKTVKNVPKQPQESRRPLHLVHALPAPVKTFPLPAFYPSNPLSLLHLAVAWLRQIISPPCEPSVMHTGIWSPSSKSVHVQDWDSVRALWEHGFFGKGSLSRSEPNWHKGQLVKHGILEAHVSEIMTNQRREKRKQDKWERARLEQEAILQIRLKEASESNGQPVDLTLHLDVDAKEASIEGTLPNETGVASEAPADSPDDNLILEAPSMKRSGVNGNSITRSTSQTTGEIQLSNGAQDTERDTPSPASDSGDRSSPKKSVRFSPTVESTTFQPSEPLSPGFVSKRMDSPDGLGLGLSTGTEVVFAPDEQTSTKEVTQEEVVNKEHLQLTLEEAFFLVFGLGVLQIVDDNKSVISTRELFDLFRRYSYFPPRVGQYEQALQPDDRFLVHYTAYHHFRSLGWVPRGGIKFGVDWLLYTRGPVFDHAAYGLIIIPSYTHPEWPTGKRDRTRTWSWFHGVSRTLSHAVKTLVLVYVDVPPPSVFDAALERGIAHVFKEYKVREVIVRRWSSNRNR
jgi:tRNA-splicing endonuclease subunit Sen2